MRYCPVNDLSGKKTPGKQSPGTRVAFYGLLIGLAFVMSYIESLLPVPVPVPGVKLGLANMVSMAALYLIGVKGAFTVSLVRILLAGLAFTGPSMMIYSMCGGVLSMLVMAALKKTGWFSIVGVSVAGGAAHNIGQLMAAAWITRTAGVFSYLPVLLAAGSAAGVAVGAAAGMVIHRISLWVP